MQKKMKNCLQRLRKKMYLRFTEVLKIIEDAIDEKRRKKCEEALMKVKNS